MYYLGNDSLIKPSWIHFCFFHSRQNPP